jgi:hypothetical protein
MLVLKQNTANSVPTPPAGKGTIFLTDQDDLAVKTNDGNVTTFPTVGGANTQVFFNDDGAIGANANLTFNKATQVLTVTGNVAATGVKTDNLYYANGNPWDLSDPGGSNTQIQFNDDESFGGSANFTWNKTSNTLVVNGTANISEINTTGNVLVGGNLTVNGNVTYINVDTLNVEDPIISLGGGPNGDPLGSDDGKDRGTALQYYSGSAKTAFMGWDNSNAEFGMGAVTTITNDVVAFSTYGNLRVGNIIGNGQALTGLAGGNVTGQVANALVAGTVYTNAQPNITSLGTLTSLLVGASALTADFPNAKVIVAQDNTGQSHSENIGLVGEAVADSGNTSTWGIGVLGEARANGATKATGVQGGAYVTNSADTGAAVGVRGYSTMTHSGGYNIGVLGNAAGSGLGNYAFYVQSGNIASIETDTAWDLNDNSATSLAFNSSGKANILRIDTTDGAEKVAMAGALDVVGNLSAGNANLGNAAVANYFIGSGANLTNLPAANISGQVANALVAGTVYTAAQPNITSVGTLTSLAVTGNVTAGNVTGANLVSANYLTGTLTTAAQPNVTSVGTLTGLSVDGSNITLANGVYVGNGSGLSAIAGGNVTGQVANALVAGTVYTAAQPNITSVGTLTSLSVTGNVSAGNVSATAGDFTSVSGNGSALTALNASNISSGTLAQARLANDSVTLGSTALTLGSTVTTVAGLTSVTSTTFVGALTGAATTAGTVTTAAQPNITSVGTLSSLAVSGNASAGNISTGGVLSVTGNANVGNIGATNGVFTNVSGNGSGLSAIAGGNVTGQVANALVAGTVYTNAQPNITSLGTLTGLTLGGNLAMGNFYITGLAEPVNSTDAATKQYVDDVAQGLNIHDSCAAATPDTLANITGGTITYNNGTAGVGATLVTTGTFNLIDGVNVQTSGTRILVKNEANAVFNGIYTYTNTTAITRAADFNSVPEVEAGDFTFVTGGTLYDNTGWVQTESPAGIGTAGNNISFTQFSGAGTYQAGTGLTLTGSTFSVNASQTQITSVGTLTSLGVSGTITASNITANTGVFTGNGSGLSAIAGANVTGTVSSATTAGTVTTAAQPNITSVGTLTSLGVNGTVTAVAFTANTGVFTGNGSGLSAIAGGNVTGQVANALVAGTVYTAAQPNITSVGTLSSLTIAANGDINMSGTGSNINGVALVSATLFEGSGANLTNLNASNISSGTLAQARLANSSLTVNGTSISLGGSGTITANTTQTLTLGSYLTGTSFNGGTAVTAAVDATTTNTASKVVARDSSGNFAAGTITATLSGAATTAGTVTTAAQPNITSVGTLTSLTVSGATSVTGNSALTVTNITSGANTTAGYMTGNWVLTTGSRFNATYADLAEKYVADASYEPGTVLVFGGEKEVSVTGMEGSTRVAGIVSTDPAYVMNAGCEGEHVVTLALIGRVPCKVEGNVRKGDLLVTSSVAGLAKVDNDAKAGTIIGKALQNFDGHHGVVEVVVGRV